MVQVHDHPNGEVAEVAGLSHGPPTGHLVQTDRIMPSLANTDQRGRESITNLKTHKVKTAQIPSGGKNLPAKELNNLRHAVKQAKEKKKSGDQTAAIAREKFKVRGFKHR